MNRVVATYIWIDAKNGIRSKSKTIYHHQKGDNFPIWNFDGSSTGQAVGDDSEVILKPQASYPDPLKPSYPCSCYLVLCDCYDKYGQQPLPSNTRFEAVNIFNQVKEHKPWYGLEQEYFLYDHTTNQIIGWPTNGFPEEQGKYYCGVGCDRAFGKKPVDEHYDACLRAGLQISGINAEVAPGQWEFQIGPCEGIDAADQLWVARYLLMEICSKHNLYVSFEPKPFPHFNGSGLHNNYSTIKMRESDTLDEIYSAIKKLGAEHLNHIKVYGDNSKRLTGDHETSRIDKFTYGMADRTASIRIPTDGHRLEDRRPASDSDPYLTTSMIAKTTLLD
jgi:glutamine synthetase